MAFQRIKSWYGRYERPISSASLIGGFIFDAITLTRVDLFWENLWVVGHLVIVGVCIILVHAVEKSEEAAEANPERLHFWLVNILQFFFGGIFSTFLVYYFRSATLTVTWPFLVLLAAAFVANESLKRHYARLTFQIALFYLSILAFAIFIVPVIIHQIGAWVFVLSGVLSLVALWIFIAILRRAARKKIERTNFWPIRAIVIGLFVGVNILYFFNLIPPLPLSLKDSGIFDTLTANAPGQYTVTYEDQGWLGFLRFHDTIHLAPGSPLYAYSAVFSPAKLNTNIVHVWEFYDPTSRHWTTRARVSLAVVGGRDGGYRTYSVIENPTPGSWRVDVELGSGALIGRMDFEVVTASTTPQLVTKEIN